MRAPALKALRGEATAAWSAKATHVMQPLLIEAVDSEITRVHAWLHGACLHVARLHVEHSHGTAESDRGGYLMPQSRCFLHAPSLGMPTNIRVLALQKAPKEPSLEPASLSTRAKTSRGVSPTS
eukprot:1161378-Pelagomonas_calceolata.AAC.4